MEEQLSVVEKIQKNNHPSLAAGNKATVERWSVSFWNMLEIWLQMTPSPKTSG